MTHTPILGDTTTATIDAATLLTVRTAIEASTDSNPTIKDIDVGAYAATTGSCTETAAHVGMKVTMNHTGTEKCYTHVHPEEHNVYDCSYWGGKLMVVFRLL